MPLLRRKRFLLEPAPSNLRANEEVFYVEATGEIFRDYVNFFNRTILCNSYVWDCEYTGKSGCTYADALKSEMEARQQMGGLPEALQQIIVTLLHNVIRTGISSLVEELTGYLRERYQVGEVLEYSPRKHQVTIVDVLPPPIPETPPSSVATTPSNLSSPANGMSPLLSHNPTPSTEGYVSVIVNTTDSPVLSSESKPADNGSKTPSSATNSVKKRSARRHKSHAIPIAEDAACQPSSYQYRIKMADGIVQLVNAGSLSRRKGILTQDKVKFFLKAALYKTDLDNKAPLHVKDEFLKKFSIGGSKVFPSEPLQLDDVNFKSPPMSSKKRHLSQSSLDMYFASSFSSSAGSSSASKKSSKVVSKSGKSLSLKKDHKKSPGTSSKTVTKSPSKSSVKPIPPKSLELDGRTVPMQSTGMVSRSPKPPRTPVKTPTKSPSLSRAASTSVIMSAKKTRTLKEIRSQLKRKFLTTDQKMKLEGEMKRKLDEKKEERKKQLQELREKKLAEKARLKELMKPKEDLLCEDSKLLPEPSQLKLRLPEEHFADVAMLLEFLSTFGPLFEVEEVIQRKITYDLIEEALLSNDIQGPLCDIVKFLLQAVFAAMEEDAELKVSLNESRGSACQSPTPPDAVSAASEANNIDKDVGKDEQDGGSSLHVKLTDASLHALWPLQHQGVALNELVLNSYTLSEVLRLHLLSSGGYHDDSERRTLRYQRRGGYTDGDNPTIQFRVRNADLLESLQYKSLFDLDVKDRLAILKILCSELLTCSLARDAIEESKYKWKKANRSYQELLKKEGHHGKTKKVKEKSKGKEEKAKGKDEMNVKDSVVTNGQNRLVEGNSSEDVQQSDEKPVVTGIPVSRQNGYCSGEEDTTVKSAIHSPQREPEDKTMPSENEEERAQKKEELRSEMFQQLSMSNLMPLGVDRVHRKYWLFHSFSGLYVEEDLIQVPPPLIDSVASSPGVLKMDTDRHASSDLVAEPPEVQPSCVVLNEEVEHPHAAINEQSFKEATNSLWKCYSSEEDFEVLLDSLNPRGIREKNLKVSLLIHKDHISSTIHKCPFAKNRTCKLSFRGYDGNLTAGEYLELCLREQILDLEEKVWTGGLGNLKDKRDRDVWRDQIESGGAAKKIELYHKMKQGADLSSEQDGASSASRTILEVAEEQDTATVAQELSQALLQIQQAIERKYLTAPLGAAIYENKKQKHKKVVIKACLDKWRSSLALASNFSQVFLHLFTLERSIAWSRSLLNLRCRVCRRKGGDESMLLCDACDNGYHMHCLRPALKKVPTGDWFCNDCKPATPVKPRRYFNRQAVLEALSEETSSDDTTEYEDDDSEESDSESSEEEVVRRSARLQKQQTTDTQSRRRGRSSRQSQPVTKKHKVLMKGKRELTVVAAGKKRRSSDSDRASSNKKSRSVQSFGVKLANITNEVALQYFDHASAASLRGKRKQAHRHLEQKLCRAVLVELLGHPDSWPFLETNQQSKLCFYEFDNTDLSSLEERLESTRYGLEDFVWDVRTIFLNCPQLHRRNSEASRAGSSLEKYFESRLAELGIRIDKDEQERKHRQFLHRMLSK